MLPSDQRRVIEQAKFTYSPLGKTFEKQRKAIENQGTKQVETFKVLKQEKNQQDLKSIEGIFPKGMITNESNNELSKTKETENTIVTKHLKYKASKRIFGLQKIF